MFHRRLLILLVCGSGVVAIDVRDAASRPWLHRHRYVCRGFRARDLAATGYTWSDCRRTKCNPWLQPLRPCRGKNGRHVVHG